MKKIILAISLLTILAGCQQQRLDKDSPEFDEKKGKVLFQGKLYTGIVFEYHRDTNTLKYEHTYKEGIMEGEYKEYYRNGQLEVKGNYIAGEREGKFESWYENGKYKSELIFKEGKNNGQWKLFFENGQLTKEVLFSNNESGYTRMWNDKGLLLYEGEPSCALYNIYNGDYNINIKEFFNAECQGPGILNYWSETGQLLMEFNFKDESNTIRKEFHENGKLHTEYYFKNDLIVGLAKRWYENGQLESEINYKDGVLDGLAHEWYKDGQIKYESRYKDGVLDGLAKEWHEDGQLKYEGTYEDNIFRRKYKEGETKSGEFIDSRDGQTYKTIDIGAQTWFAENLNYDTIDSWWYENKKSNGDVYGRLYNWDAAMVTCPEGWHLPSDDEWKVLEMQLGMSQSVADVTGWRDTDEGSKLKSTTGWNNNGNGTNSSGFSALPGGYRSTTGDFYFRGYGGYWWLATGYSSTDAWHRLLRYNYDEGVARYYYGKDYGFSVRCVRD